MELEPTIFVVDDDADFRHSLEWMLRKSGFNVNTFKSAEDFIESYDPDVPGCMLLDLCMPGMNGPELQERMIEQDWIAPVIFLSGHADIPMTVAALQAGAVSLLEKPFRREDLLDCIHKALDIDTETRRYRVTRAEFETRFATLTHRERQVMALIIEGKTTKEIGHHLDVCHRMIEIHRSRVMKKICVSSPARLADLAVRYNFGA